MNQKESISHELSLAIKVDTNEIASMLEVPADKSHGDLSLPCFRLAKLLKKSPAQIAQDLSLQLNAELNAKKLKGIRKIEPVNGYLNFYFDSALLASDIIPAILSKKEKFFQKKSSNPKKIMVEYSAPNTNKPLHVGHLRNDSIGMAISNILEFEGNIIVRANMVNDRGIHICQSMLAYKKYGGKTSPKDEHLKGDKFVGKYYVLFHQNAKEDPSLEEEAKKLLNLWEKNDKETRALWKKMNSWVLEGFKQTYKTFGSKFDVFLLESEFYDKAKPIIDAGLEKGVFKKEETGRILALLESEGLPNKVILREDGTSIYVTNDLAMTLHKFKNFKLDESIWVVASEQNLYFKQLFTIFKLLGYAWADNCYHMSYGMIFLPEGKMKSREGKVIDADDLIDEVKELAKKELLKRYSDLSAKELEKRAHAISLAAIKFMMLKIDHEKDFTFVPEQSISFEGHSGPYLQYTYARAKSILAKAKNYSLKNADFSKLNSGNEVQLIKLINDLPAVIEHVAETKSIHALANHLLTLADSFNSFYHESQVLNADLGLKEARLSLTEAVSISIKTGLQLLNMQVLEKM